jgi:hypothetical protein
MRNTNPLTQLVGDFFYNLGKRHGEEARRRADEKRNGPPPAPASDPFMDWMRERAKRRKK